MKLQTPKGFRDFLPADALKRKAVADRIISVFERFGFDPIETPTVEYEETLQGKYGEEEKLIYKFETARFKIRPNCAFSKGHRPMGSGWRPKINSAF